MSLGILANVISEPSIIEDFTVHDSSLDLVEKVVELCSKVSDIAVLVQVFSVLRRIVWYLKNISSVKKWLDLLQSVNFLGVANFIMRSSRNGTNICAHIFVIYNVLSRILFVKAFGVGFMLISTSFGDRYHAVLYSFGLRDPGKRYCKR